jgi:uncharacterized protein YjbI with pentapeptide repeats
MTTDKLKQILENHKKWLRNEGGERADLHGADLHGADLRYTDLRRANMRGANLSGINVYGANLSYADLEGSDLSYNDLRYADLRYTDLSYANLSYAELHEINLSGANLNGANLSYADLRGANLSDIVYNETTAFFALQCPEEGAFIGWKKCEREVIVKLLIPEDAKRSSATSRKCRASKAIVLEVIGAEKAVSKNDMNFIYEVGKEMIPDSFDEDRWNECSHGIHFFLTRNEAERY